VYSLRNIYIYINKYNQVVQNDVYADRDRSNGSNVQKHVAGKNLTVQISGYKWLSNVQADELGMKFEGLSAVTGMYLYVYVCMYTCVYIFLCMYIVYTYIYIYIYIYE
jgi:hypothetical protein